MRLTTAITAATPMTTPMSVRTLRSLCAQRLEVAIATASEKFIVDGLAMGERRDRIALILTYAGEGAGITWRARTLGDAGVSRRNGRRRRKAAGMTTLHRWNLRKTQKYGLEG